MPLRFEQKTMADFLPYYNGKQRNLMDFKGMIRRIHIRAKLLIPQEHMGRNKSAPGETRTPDPLLRRQLLCPAELQAHPNSFSRVPGRENRGDRI